MANVLLLLGGGHAHLQALTSPLPTPATTRILLSDSPTAVYSGLLPAVIAGLRPPAAAEIHLPTLCAANNTTFIHGRVTAIHPHRNKVSFRPYATAIECELPYDVLSINVGSTTRPLVPLPTPVPTPTVSTLPIVVPTRPIANLNNAIATFHHHSTPTQPVVVIGAGAAGIELTLALSTRLENPITLVSRTDALASQFGRITSNLVTTELRRRNIHHHHSKTVVSLDRETSRITLHDGTTLPFSLAVLATGPAPHAWLRRTGLPTDADGWLLADPTLTVSEYSNVFAAGDCVSFGDYFGPDNPPKAGVYAVRQGPILAHNLAVAVRGSGKMREFHPQACFLSLLSTGDGRAIGSKYGIAFRGAWVYRLKSFIDESWQERFRVSKGRGKVAGGSSGVDDVFDGSPVEGAAVLHLADEIGVDDSFDKQLTVLKRMDADKAFRDELVNISLEHMSLVSSK